MSAPNRQWQLTAYADGLPGPEHFTLVETAAPEPGEGQIVVRAHAFGLDPFPRLRMSAGGGVPPLPLGSVMIGRGVGQIVASRHPDYAAGEFVAGELGWQMLALLDGTGLTKVDPALGPVSTSLGVLGPPGLAATFALRQAGPRPGDTVVISGAAGAVGSVAGQLAQLAGCRAVGIADGSTKCGYWEDELGCDTAVDYTATDDLAAAIKQACPDGVDVFLDLVGGTMHDAVMANLNVGARIVLVGTIANYNDPQGDTGPRNLLPMILKRARMSGFLVADYAAEFPAALAELAARLAAGDLVYKETVVTGFDNLPRAFGQVFAGDQVGKFLVRVEGPEDSQ
jgi:NADPH-dependent curcumin reductase CurA